MTPGKARYPENQPDAAMHRAFFVMKNPRYTIEKYDAKENWYLLMEGQILRAAGSLEHCQRWLRRLQPIL